MMATEQQENRFQYRRMPAVPRKISDILPEKDVRVRLLGRVIDKYDGIIVMDDGSGKIEIVAEENFDKIAVGSVVRAFCRVLPIETGYELRAEIVQDMSQLDLDTYIKVHANADVSI